MPYISIDGVLIWYEVHGKGEPLLFLHGWTGSISSFKRNVLKKIAPHARVILIDLPGHGRSGCMRPTAEHLRRIIDILLDGMYIDKVTIAGHSMGAVVALDYSLARPERVEKLILIEPHIEFPTLLYPLLVHSVRVPLLRFFLHSPTGLGITRRYMLLRDHWYRADFFSRSPRVNTLLSLDYVEMMHKCSIENRGEKLKALAQRLHVVIGSLTLKSIRKGAALLQKTIDGTAMHVIRGAGHFPIDENRDATAAVLLAIIGS
jgi:pimeloyl-ACP methyl ester carboxylesterase